MKEPYKSLAIAVGKALAKKWVEQNKPATTPNKDLKSSADPDTSPSTAPEQQNNRASDE